MSARVSQWITGHLVASGLKELSRNEVLFRATEVVSKIYVVQSGELRLSRPLSHGSALTVHRALPGSIVAEASLFSSYYHCDAIVEKDCQLLIYSKELVTIQLLSNPEFSELLCQFLASEIQLLRTRLELANIKSADERVLTWIRLQARNNVVTLRQSLRSIASELGLAHETFYRSLRKLEVQKQISRNKEKIILNQSG